MSGRRDPLLGLKENVIIGKLIPAGTGLPRYTKVQVEPTEQAKTELYPSFGYDEIDFPALGVWAAILLGALFRRPAWHEVVPAAKGAAFLIALVLCASMMPVDELPAPSWPSAFGLGFVSSVFDNIPLTKLALEQGGYDWALLAFAVGFGGSMIWFGSSAGVAVAGLMPEARSAARWLKEGWPVALAYVAGFFLLLALLGWNPQTI